MSTPELKERRRPSRAETRERVLDAAVQLFYELGPKAATLDAVAARAGLTKGAIYSSFASKDELFAAAVERLPTTLFRDVLADVGPSRDEVRGALREFGATIAGLPPRDESQAVLHELYALSLRNPTTRDTIARWVAGMIDDASATGGEHLRLTVSYRELWIVGQALIEGMLMRRAINPELVSDELLVAAIELLAGFVE